LQSHIDLEFADGVYSFALPVPQIQELQRKCETGVGALYARIVRGHRVVDGDNGPELIQIPTQAEFHVLDIIETIRHGLIGGGRGFVNEAEIKVSPQLANRLVATYVEGKPLAPNWAIAASVMTACICGYDPPKKAGPATEPAEETAEPTAG
jgi:hypothetical protein